MAILQELRATTPKAVKETEYCCQPRSWISYGQEGEAACAQRNAAWCCCCCSQLGCALSTPFEAELTPQTAGNKANNKTADVPSWFEAGPSCPDGGRESKGNRGPQQVADAPRSATT